MSESESIRLFANQQSGHIVCLEHAGVALSGAVERRPRAKSWTTQFGRSVLVTDQDRAEWLQEFGEPMMCETCRHRATPQPAPITAEMATAAMANTSIPQFEQGTETDGPVWWFEDFLRLISIDVKDGTTISIALNDGGDRYGVLRYDGDDPSAEISFEDFATLDEAVAFAATI